MQRVLKRFMVVLMALSLLALSLPLVAAAEKVPKIDNFVVMIDQSGSMAQKNDAFKQKKIDLAIDLIKKLDRVIPELNYKGGVVLVAPYQVVSPPTTYKEGSLSSAVSGVNADFRVFGRETALGDSLKMSDAVLNGLSGKTALILLTDGANNLGSDPVAEARALYSKYGDKLCIHVISMDNDPDGAAIIKEIRGLKSCSVAADVASFGNQAALEKYARAVFYDDADDPCARDTDGDGVADCRDKCPGTLPGAMVDEDGCALKHTMQIEFDFDKADIRPEYHDKIAEAAAFIKRYPKTQILVAGHTDSTGDADYNKALSMKRAEALEAYLVEKFGINDDQLFPRGYGESRPIATNDSPEGRQQNRRVEFICCTIIPPQR